MDAMLVRQVLVVSGLGALAVVVLQAGLQEGRVALVAVGAALAVPAIAGIVALARVVVVSERRRGRR